MANEFEKEKHSKRLHKTESKIKNRVKFAKRMGISTKRTEVEANRYSKLHPLDCGKPNCVMCGNPRKFWKQGTIQEQRDKQDIIQEE